MAIIVIAQAGCAQEKVKNKVERLSEAELNEWLNIQLAPANTNEIDTDIFKVDQKTPHLLDSPLLNYPLPRKPAMILPETVANKVPNKNQKPSRWKNAIPPTFIFLRYLHDSRGFRVLKPYFNINLPGSVSVFGVYNFTSRQNSGEEQDLQNFGGALEFYSPHISKIGVVASYIDGSGTGNSVWRPGVYFGLNLKTKNFKGIFLPAFYPIAENSRNRSVTIRSVLRAYDWIFFSSRISYNYFEDQDDNFFTNNGLGFRFLRGMYLMTSYETNTDKNIRDSIQFGIEIQSTF